MIPTNEAATGGSEQEPVDIAVHQAAGDGRLSTREAANAVIDWRRKRRARQAAQPR